MGKPTGSWRTVPKSRNGLSGIEGENPYQARLGARVEPYGVFWLKIDEVFSKDRMLVTNLSERGKRTVDKVNGAAIEPDLVYPAVTGGDIRRWGALPSIHILMAQNPETCEPYSETEMKKRWPLTYAYLLRFRNVLLSRGSKTVRQFAERTAFYAMFGIGPYTVARYRVVWKRMASDMVAAVISQQNTPVGFKTVIATDTTSLIPTAQEKEAHYLCAIINSTPVREFVKSYSSAGRGFGAPAVMQHVGIPKFDNAAALHLALAELSLKCHAAKTPSAAGKLTALEAEVDRAVRQLFRL
jgi:hypothetical protein